MSKLNEKQPNDSTEPNCEDGVDCRPMSCYALDVGEPLQRGDFFLDEGKEYHMDNMGRVMGLRVLGHPVKKGDSWYRHNV